MTLEQILAFASRTSLVREVKMCLQFQTYCMTMFYAIIKSFTQLAKLTLSLNFYKLLSKRVIAPKACVKLK